MTTSMGEWTTDGPAMGEQWWRDTAIALRAALDACRQERDQLRAGVVVAVDQIEWWTA